MSLCCKKILQMVDLTLKSLKRSFSNLSFESDHQRDFQNLTSLEIIDPITNELIPVPSCTNRLSLGISSPLLRSHTFTIKVDRRPPPIPYTPPPSTPDSRTSSVSSSGRFSFSSKLTDISSFYSLSTLKNVIKSPNVPLIKAAKPNFRRLKIATKQFANSFKRLKREKKPIAIGDISCCRDNSPDNITMLQDPLDFETDVETVPDEFDNITGALIYYLNQENTSLVDYSDLHSLFLNLVESSY